jgi:hypothetical protein
MEEKKLVMLLVIVGIISFSAMAVSNLLFSNILMKFSSSLIPFALCQKDENGNYLLSDPNLTFCGQSNNMEKITDNPTICDGYSGDKRNACNKLIEIAKKRESDCLAQAFGKNQTSVNSIEVKQNCDLLSPPVPSKEINSSLSIVGNAILPLTKFFKS